MRRRAEKRDDSEKEVVEALEAHGATIDRLPGGNGRPDLLVGLRGMTALIEVKTGNGRLNEEQKTWHGSWKGGKPVILRNRAQADAWCRTAHVRLENVVRSLPIEAGLGVEDEWLGGDDD